MTKLNFFDSIYVLIGVPFLFFNIATARGFTELKIVLLGLLVIFSFFEILITNKRINKKILFFVLNFVLYFLMSLFLGIFNGFEFLLGVDFAIIQYYFITPISILFLFHIFYKKEYRLIQALKYLKFITLFVVIMNVLKIFSFKKIIPDIDFFNLFLISSDLNGSNITIRIANEGSLMFLLPIYIVLFFLDSNKESKMTSLLIFLFGMIYAFLSGRKMLILVSLVTLGVMIFKELVTRKIKLRNMCILIIIGCCILIVLNQFSKAIGIENIFFNIYQTVRSGLSKNAYGVVSRKEDFNALIDMWLKSPLIGYGLNSYAINELANPITKWSYEIVYVALLAQTGIIGCFILFFAIIYISGILIKKFKLTHNKYYFAFLMGFISFIICGASNPLIYILWPWVFTLAICFSSNANFNYLSYEI